MIHNKTLAFDHKNISYIIENGKRLGEHFGQQRNELLAMIQQDV